MGTPPPITLKPQAPRLDTLAGKTIAQLWDELFKGDVVFELLEEGLKKRYPGVKFVSWREFGSTHGGNGRFVDGAPKYSGHAELRPERRLAVPSRPLAEVVRDDVERAAGARPGRPRSPRRRGLGPASRAGSRGRGSASSAPPR